MVDFGVPQILEPDVLKRYVLTEAGGKGIDLSHNAELQEKICAQATGAVSWRAEGIRYKKNEVYIDVVEKLNVLFSQTGQILRADVSGEINVNCLLSGMPECKFGVNDKLVTNKTGSKLIRSNRGIVLDDIRCHQCVSLSRFETDRTITFVPPDGQFRLMEYRITENINLPFQVFPVVQQKGRTRIECSVKVKSTFAKTLNANDVVVRIPVPKNTAKATMSTINAGKAKFEPTESAIVWRIRRFPGQADYTLYAEVDLVPTVGDSHWVRPPIGVEFQIPSGNYSASGLAVRFLIIQEKSNYKLLKWIRYITAAPRGTYMHRI
eukprot:Selendium_serpulae@DN5430_c0_g1_i2.p1